MSQISRFAGDGPGQAGCVVGLGRTDGTAVLAVSGELDAATVDQLQEPLRRVAASDQSAIIDLTECGFIDSAVVATLVAVARSMATEASELRLVAKPGSQPLRVLEITGLNGRLPVYGRLADALGAQAAAVAASRLPGNSSG
jgi:anti-sigma B factor antagonist